MLACPVSPYTQHTTCHTRKPCRTAIGTSFARVTGVPRHSPRFQRHHPGGFPVLPIHKILHPTDFSDLSHAAFDVACALARDYSAELLIVHVNRPAPIFAPDGIAVAVPAEEPYELHAKLARMCAEVPDVKVTHHLLTGEPADEILKCAQHERADLIVLGTHGSTGLTRLLMGSVAESVSRKAPCPLLTVRKPFATAVHAKLPETISATV
jgi:nucleotide-binding universal stress UspA family protein